MVEQDYIMRLIRELVRALLKVIFHSDLDMPSVEMQSQGLSELAEAFLSEL